MGANEWRTSTSWPPPEAEARSFYLGSNGGATLHYGDGRLDDECPAEDDRWDSYLYIAHKPVITNGGSILQIAVGTPGPRDQSRAESRDDVLCYSTEPLQRPLDVAGPVSVDLFVSSDRPDTDFTAKLVDVQPDGKPISLTDGIIRARFREGFDHEVLLEPGKVAEVTIDLASIAHRFAAGHRIRLEISSSNYPRFMPNPNTRGGRRTRPRRRSRRSTTSTAAGRRPQRCTCTCSRTPDAALRTRGESRPQRPRRSSPARGPWRCGRATSFDFASR